ncbi:hypothetical protein [Pseudomonas sp. GL-RE-29]|uniref:hypothetical protein n=1 Tax=Pseudomonas sp. GL-RE-29 TaxID=2832375 RepID=UPI001CBBB493|nr:hypothetical protein [Pseudomonas sp. GL-RE-29]
MRIYALIVAIFLIGTAQASESTIVGFAGYEFGMTLDQANSVRSNDKVTDCTYVNAFKCIEYETNIYGEAARVIAQVGKASKKIDKVVVNFNYLSAAAKSKACLSTHKKISARVFEKYGKNFQSPVQGIYDWYLPDGGRVTYSGMCVTDDQGIVIVSYTQSEGL